MNECGTSIFKIDDEIFAIFLAIFVVETTIDNNPMGENQFYGRYIVCLLSEFQSSVLLGRRFRKEQRKKSNIKNSDFEFN